jgi:hypothetical protein
VPLLDFGGNAMKTESKDVPPVIINGPHGESIGTLTGLDGSLIPIWSDSPADLLQAMLAAIGPLPEFDGLGIGGTFEVTGQTGEGIHALPVYTYNPAGDVQNQTAVAAFTAKVTAWNARAAAIQSTVQAMLQLRSKA